MIQHLDPGEVHLALWVGDKRAESGSARERTSPYGHPEESARVDRRSCIAELGVAKAMNLYWRGLVSGRVDREECEVGGFIDVRSVNRPNRGLIVHDRDEDSRVLVLAHVPIPGRGWKVSGLDVHIYGWMCAGDSKNTWYASNAEKVLPRPEGCYLVPCSDLLPLEDLRQVKS